MKGQNKMKKLIAILMILTATASVSAAEIPVDIRVNGEYIKTYSDPVIEDGVTYAAVRAVADALSATDVDWNDSEKTATIVCDGNTAKIIIGSSTAYINGKKIPMSAQAFILNNRTYIPVRFLSELFGADVTWDGTYKNVNITKEDIDVPRKIIDTSFTHDELYWMSRIINAESAGEDFKGQIAVGDVILNRVRSKEFPNTIYGVIFDRKYSVQFEPVLNGSIYNHPTEKSIAAAKISMTTPSSVGNCLYFFNPSIASSSWISKNRQYFTSIGNHDFYL